MYAESVTLLTPETIANLEVRRERLSSYWSDYNNLQAEIESLCEDEGDDRVSFEEAFYELTAELRCAITNYNRTIAGGPAMISTSIAPPAGVSNSASNVRLPKLDLPNFTGKYEEWFPFYEMFNSIINDNHAISNLQKFQYLRASVTGEAANVIQSLELSEQNYLVAWNALKHRYNNKRAIVHTHLRALFELPSIAKENAFELRRVADSVVKHVQALSALHCPTEHWDEMLIYLIPSKFDPITTREWHASLSGTELPTYKQFVDFLEQRCQLLESVNKGAVAQTNGRRLAAHAATTAPACSYCHGEHPIYYCPEQSIRAAFYLDSGSQANFIARSYAERLQLRANPSNIKIIGINGTTSSASEVVVIKLHSRLNEFAATIECIITDRITERLPVSSIDRTEIRIPPTIKLADPDFHRSSDIDALVGAELFWQLICVGQLRASHAHPTLQKTHFGWVLAGRFGGETRKTRAREIGAFCASITESELQNQLARFWQLEESCRPRDSYSSVERFCEKHFRDNTTRDDQGRVIVTLPINEDKIRKLGDTRDVALRRFYALEKRLDRDPILKSQYSNFIHEYTVRSSV
ncbi:uncharacterized protein LOC143895317 [Temnothorax americanus]|uniref:uncharacterized protein LOC143895317 n=1 Tax=Temnothorax americanus TaxID=1964332 RepID=UPI004067602B